MNARLRLLLAGLVWLVASGPAWAGAKEYSGGKFPVTGVVRGSSAEAQLIERKNAQVITDNIGAQEMRANGDSDAAAAMRASPGLGRGQPVRLRPRPRRALQQHHAGGSVVPTTEPDKKVVPLDLFPTALHRQRAGRQVLLADRRRSSPAGSCRSCR
jgi:hypothetical protein